MGRFNEYNGKTILITGGAGCIGSNLCKKISELDLASCRTMEFIKIAGLGMILESPFNSERLRTADTVFFNMALDSKSALGGKRGNALNGTFLLKFFAIITCRIIYINSTRLCNMSNHYT